MHIEFYLSYVTIKISTFLENMVHYVVCVCVLVCFVANKIKAKWSSIRSSYSRELRVEREAAKSGSGKRKVAVYIYTRNLAFLRPHMKLKTMTDNTTVELAPASVDLQVGGRFNISHSTKAIYRIFHF